MCLRCYCDVEDWQHFLNCKFNANECGFLLSTKRRLSEMSEFQAQSLIIMQNIEKFIDNEMPN